jgi:hypothetical protein
MSKTQTKTTVNTFVYLPTGSIKDDYFNPETMLLGENNKVNGFGFDAVEPVEGYPQLIRISTMCDMGKDKWQDTGDTSWCLLIDPLANWQEGNREWQQQADNESWVFVETPKPVVPDLPKNLKTIKVTTTRVTNTSVTTSVEKE